MPLIPVVYWVLGGLGVGGVAGFALGSKANNLAILGVSTAVAIYLIKGK